jgi:RimJ/RimL family protein N-acetyltransferase
MAGDMVLTTDRLTLREWKASDLAAFATINADPRVMEFFPGVLSREESDAAAARAIEHFTEHGFGRWAIEVQGGAEFIGFAGLNVVPYETPFTPCVEIGWRLAFDYWGRGYATEAARAALADGFTRLGLSEIVSFTVPANSRSWRVMEKIGMKRADGEDFDHPLLPAGHWLRRHVLYRGRREG